MHVVTTISVCMFHVCYSALFVFVHCVNSLGLVGLEKILKEKKNMATGYEPTSLGLLMECTLMRRCTNTW